jgi:hypothetical protein
MEPKAECGVGLATRQRPTRITHSPWKTGVNALVGRGRDASYLAPPAQNRTCGFPAYGSHLG